MKNKGGFISVEKLEISRKVQAQPTSGSPFFFEDIAPEQPTKSGFIEWLAKHKIGVGIGSAAFIVTVISAVNLIW